jgi:hypothetical protein
VVCCTIKHPHRFVHYIFYYMASVLKIILCFLRRLRFPKDCYTKRCSGLWAWLLTFIFRKLGLSCLWHKSPGTPHRERPADPSFSCIDARGYSVLGGSTDVVAASIVPTSASLPDLRERAPSQLTTTIPSGPITSPVLNTGNLTADSALSAYDVTRPRNRSSANLSIRSCASDRLSILTQSRESLRAPVGQPSRLSRGTYRQFGLGPKQIPSREQLSRSPSPSTRFFPLQQASCLEEDTTILPTSDVVNSATSPTALALSSYTHDPLSPPTDRRRQSSDCVTVDIQTPSTESLTLKSSCPQSISAPFAMDSPTVHTSAVSVAANIHKHSSPTPHPMAPDFSLPEGRYVALINSDQVPRYSSNIKMWVNVFVLLFYP